MGDVVQRIVVKREEDVADAICLAIDELDVLVDLLFNGSGYMILECRRLRVGMRQYLFAYAVFLRGMESEQVLLAIHIEHAVE